MSSLTPWRGRGSNRGSDLTYPLVQLQREFGELLNSFFGQSSGDWAGEFASPRFWDFDVADRGNEVIVRAETPGFDAKDLDVQVHNDTLTIRAEKQQEQGQQQGGGAYQQRYASFRRTVTLPPGIDPDKAQADYRNGVLEIRFPKTEQAQAKRIAIQGHGRPSEKASPSMPAGQAPPKPTESAKSQNPAQAKPTQQAKPQTSATGSKG